MTHYQRSTLALQLATLSALVAYLDTSPGLRHWAALLAVLLLCLVVVDALLELLRHRPR